MRRPGLLLLAAALLLPLGLRWPLGEVLGALDYALLGDSIGAGSLQHRLSIELNVSL